MGILKLHILKLVANMQGVAERRARPKLYCFKWNTILFKILKSAYFYKLPHIGFAKSIPSI